MRRRGSMLKPGDAIALDLGMHAGSEAGLRRPAIVVTAALVLAGGPNVVQVVPLTRAIRTGSTDVLIDPDEDSGLAARSSVQCQHLRSVATDRIHDCTGNVSGTPGDWAPGRCPGAERAAPARQQMRLAQNDNPLPEPSRHRACPFLLTLFERWASEGESAPRAPGTSPSAEQRIQGDEVAPGPVFLTELVVPVPLDRPVRQVEGVR